MINPLQQDLDHVLSRTGDLWGALRGSRFFITGGTGFLGRWLLESLVWAVDRLGLEIRAAVLSRDPVSFRIRAPHLAGHPAIDVIQGDVCHFNFPTGSFSHVIHAAADPRPVSSMEGALLMLDTIITGTRRTLDFSVACGARQYLFISSGAVYGRQPPDVDRMSEDFAGAPDVMNPLHAYGHGKRMAEHLCAIFRHRAGLETKIARCFSFVGPFLPLDENYAIGNFIRDALAGRPIVVKGDGTPCRSYLYAADLAVWLWKILTSGAPCRPYNVGSDDDLPVSDVARMVAAAAGGRVRILQSPSAEKPARYVPDVSRAGEELGLRNWIDLSSGIKKTLDYWRGQAPNRPS